MLINFVDCLCSGRFLEYILDRPDVQCAWEKFTKHDFVEGMGQGTLPVERFKEYLVQDYLYLVRLPYRCICINLALLTNQITGSICPQQCSGRIQVFRNGLNSSSSCASTQAPHIHTANMFQSAQIVLHIQREMSLHLDYCASFGLSKQEMEASPETIGKDLAFLLSVV